MNKTIDKLKPIFKYILKRLKTITPFESFVLVTIVALTVLLVKYFKIKETELNIRLQVFDYQWATEVDPHSHKMPFWKADQLKIGQAEYDSQGKPLATIIDIQRYNGNTEGAEVYLTVKLKVDYNKVTRQYTFKNKTIDLGGIIELKMYNIHILGKVTNNNTLKNTDLEINMEPTWKNIRVRDAVTPFWMANKLSVGQKMLNTEGETIAEITNIERYEASAETSDLYLDVKLKTLYEEKSKQYLFNSKTVNLSNLITLQFNNIVIDQTQIIDDDLPENGYKKKEMIVTGRWDGVETWQIDQMKVGDKMINEADGNAIAEILKIRYETPLNNIFVYRQGEINAFPHPNRKNVIFTVKVSGFEYDSKLYFAGHQRIKSNYDIVVYGKDITYKILVQGVTQVKDITDKK